MKSQATPSEATDTTSGAPTPGLVGETLTDKMEDVLKDVGAEVLRVDTPLIKRRAKIVTRVTLTTPWPDGVTNMADARLIVNSRIKAVLTNAAWQAHGLSTEITEVQ